MKKLFALCITLALSASTAFAQPSGDTVNGWYFSGANGTGIDTAYTYICDTTAAEGTKSQAFVYSTSGGAAYAFTKDIPNGLKTPERISVSHRLINGGPLQPFLLAVAQLILVGDDTTLTLRGRGNWLNELPTPNWGLDLGWVIDSLRFRMPIIRKMIFQFTFEANSPNPPGKCVFLLDNMRGFYHEDGVLGFKEILIERFGDIGPAQFITPKNCQFKSPGSNGVRIDSFRLVNMNAKGLIIGNRIVSTNSLFSIDGTLPWGIESRDSVTVYVRFKSDGTAGKKSGLIIVTHTFGVDTAFVSADGTTDVRDGNEEIPIEFSLSRNYPNPFNPSTKIAFSVPRSGEVTLIVYDAMGREVAVLARGTYAAGNYEETFDGSSLSSGIYFARMIGTGFTKTVKMVLLK